MTKIFTYYPGKTTRAEVEAYWPNLDDLEWQELQTATEPTELEPSPPDREVEEDAKPNGNGNGAHTDNGGAPLTAIQLAAVQLVGLGLRVFRIKRGTKDHIIDKGWNRGEATGDRFEVIKRFEGGPFNIGVHTGDGFVLDCDVSRGGLESLAQLERECGPFPDTFRVRSARGGLHVFFRGPNGEKFGASALLPGIDVKAMGGYVVGAGSEFYDKDGNGGAYAPIDGFKPIAVAPDNGQPALLPIPRRATSSLLRAWPINTAAPLPLLTIAPRRPTMPRHASTPRGKPASMR